MQNGFNLDALLDTPADRVAERVSQRIAQAGNGGKDEGTE